MKRMRKRHARWNAKKTIKCIAQEMHSRLELAKTTLMSVLDSATALASELINDLDSIRVSVLWMTWRLHASV